MTEDEYIDVRNLQALITACDAINRILPYENEIINESEFREIESKLMYWRSALFEKIDKVMI